MRSVDSQGRWCIPYHLRSLLGIAPGNSVLFLTEGNTIAIMKAPMGEGASVAKVKKERASLPELIENIAEIADVTEMDVPSGKPYTIVYEGNTGIKCLWGEMKTGPAKILLIRKAGEQFGKV